MCARSVYVIILLLHSFILSPTTEETEITLDRVIDWADNIGTELFEIGKEVTKLENIADRYSAMNASVEKTDGVEMLDTIVNRMNKLVKEKVDAVLRIKNAAMEAERNHTKFNDTYERFAVQYRSSKFSNVSVPPEYDLEITLKVEEVPSEDAAYTEMVLVPDPHFKDVLVNTNYSSVHVPTNIFDRWDNVITPISWSEAIDDTFKSNYDLDPSLMWQYYASTSGFLRHFPAFHWSMLPDRYDCRRRIWYVQAATCSKEVVILIDNSGTMYGMRNTIAQLTVDYLLQTFSNNDYISIFRLTNEQVFGLVKCFEDTLIQATPENIELFRNALYRMCPEKKINFFVGFNKAFKILHDFKNNKTEHTEKRNQAVFLLTDMMPSPNVMETILKDYHDIYNDTNTQVELFIYFIGKDIPDIREMQWEKCLRNGSIVHVRTMDEAPEDALKYLSILARTQNESTEFYPVSWTHTFLDIKRDQGTLATIEMNDTNEVNKQIKEEEEASVEDPDAEYGNVDELRIMTSVTTPVYSSSKSNDKDGSERSTNHNNNNKKEEMIGVAAIDVPIDDFRRLTMAHKIGVNGYAFVVTNNGYVLFHPNLRPVVDKKVRENFNSVDLSEVEFYDDNNEQPRAQQQEILELRKKMVNQDSGNLTGLRIKFQYHDMKRVGTEYRNYYFKPLKCSPFSVGLALPQGYGNYWVKTTEEIQKTKSRNDDYKKYFQGGWTIHPEWTYCDFRNNTKYDPRYKADRREKLLDFLELIFASDNDFVWVEEHMDYNATPTAQNASEAEICFSEKATEKPKPEYMKPYFCDKELMELLFFDAKLTAPEFEESYADNLTFMNDNGIRLKFVATQGGLTRWKNFIPDSSSKSFGDRNGTALDEVWYKSAVLLHVTDSQDFVLSIPQQYYGNSLEKYITASYAVFYEEGGQEAPGVVVGFQFAYKTLKNIVERKIGLFLTRDTAWDCYIVDANGYIIYSRYEHEIGKFYGTIDGGGALMVDMVQNELYRNISMFDYQGLKLEEKKDSFTVGASSSLINPFSFVIWSLNWVLSNIVWLLIESNLWQLVNAASSCSSVTSLKNTTSCSTCKQENKTCPICCKAPIQYEDTCQTREVLPHMEKAGSRTEKPRKMSIDRRFFLYLYTNLSINGYSSAMNPNHTDCSRPYFLKRIKYTNLNLLLVRANHSACYINVNVEPVEYEYSQTEDGRTPACNKIMMNSYPRKKLLGCSDKIPPNRTRELCGSSGRVEVSAFLILSIFFVRFVISCS